MQVNAPGARFGDTLAPALKDGRAVESVPRFGDPARLAILGRQAIFVRLIHLSHTGPSSVTLILWTSLRKGLRVVGTPVAE